ncbi:MAG: hypothetical protein ABI743_12285 [bacterium]
MPSPDFEDISAWIPQTIEPANASHSPADLHVAGRELPLIRSEEFYAGIPDSIHLAVGIAWAFTFLSDPGHASPHVLRDAMGLSVPTQSIAALSTLGPVIVQIAPSHLRLHFPSLNCDVVASRQRVQIDPETQPGVALPVVNETEGNAWMRTVETIPQTAPVAMKNQMHLDDPSYWTTIATSWNDL